MSDDKKSYVETEPQKQEKPIWILKMKVNGKPTIAFSWDGAPSKSYTKYMPAKEEEK